MIESKKAGAMEGFELTLRLFDDPWTTTEDDEGLTAKQIEAWQNDEWFYVTAEVVASIAGVELGSASYPSIQWGSVPQTDEDDNLLSVLEITVHDIDAYVGTELAYQALENAREKLAEILKIMEENK